MSVQPISAEKYAEQLLRKAWDAGSALDLRAIADEASLTVREVETIRDRLLSGRKDQPRPVVPLRVEPPAQVAEAESWRRAVDHPSARIRRAAAKAVVAVAAVDALLAEDEGKAQLRKREARLLAELNKVRAELRGTAPAAPTSADKVPCPDCGDPVHPNRLPQHRLRSAKHA